MMQLKHGIFDEASISVIASDTVLEIAQRAGVSPDVRRFQPNLVVRLLHMKLQLRFLRAQLEAQQAERTTRRLHTQGVSTPV